MPSKAKGTAQGVDSWELSQLEMAEEAFFNLRASYRLIRRPADSGVRAGLILRADQVVDDAPGPERNTRKRHHFQEVMERLEKMRDRCDEWTSQRVIAKKLGCSHGLVGNVIKKSPKLQTWTRRFPKAPPAIGLNDVVLANARQGTEADPANVLLKEDEERVWALLLEQASPAKRKELEVLTPDGRLEITRLAYEQEEDLEPSPFEHDPCVEKPLKVKVHQRL